MLNDPASAPRLRPDLKAEISMLSGRPLLDQKSAWDLESREAARSAKVPPSSVLALGAAGLCAVSTAAT